MSSKSASIDKSGREAKLEAIRRQNDADKRRQRIITMVTVAVILGLAAAVGIVIFLAIQDRDQAASADPASLVTVANADGVEVDGFDVGPAEADVTVTIFEDFQCPACKAFEDTAGGFMDGLPDEGVRVVFSPVAFLDRFSGGTDYSTRSSGSFACVAQDDTADGRPVLNAYKSLLFANQPAEGATGLTNEQLVEFALQAGAPESAQQCIQDEGFRGWATRNSEAAVAAGVGGTPTIWVNGERVGPDAQVASQADIEAAIEAARAE
jgi:protein-disulfide isomerase